MDISAVPVYPTNMDIKIKNCEDNPTTFEKMETKSSGEFEEINLQEESEETTMDNHSKTSSNVIMKGLFVCHSDPNCRACQDLPFRRFSPIEYDSPHLSEALDIVNGQWVIIPRVFSDTPLEPWMDNYIIPDLERESRK
ncbi:protein V32 [Canid alphaherpesvirus 1]|uniref:Protein V32 n=1 Tax=Canid alphaherpesvirus 1 TaxID=170325 RepID=A0A172DS92_9ALPH|nr:protein V32 [Canid alphaherpesvirus 1]ALL25988.1 protein V32 [Canid alphaherpesvirus 1]AQX83345.1 protein V32 [Canid alphaherpesvirus 1]ARE29836.1 protein V32 [Canid alphaherpesvirus 1]QQL08481.1 protein V32 [Canid alphaherpesvirus 1]